MSEQRPPTPPPGNPNRQNFPPPPPVAPPYPPYQLNYALPENQRTGMSTAFKVILIILLVCIGLGLLAFGLCMAAFIH